MTGVQTCALPISTGKSDLVLKNYNQVLAIRREIGDKEGTANVLNDLGDFCVRHGKYDDALRLFKESLQSQIEIHNDSMQGQVLNNIGNTYYSKGDYENARTYYERALQVREKLKMPSDIADTMNNLADTSMRTGQFEQAQDQYLKALDIRRSSGDGRGAALASSGLGTLFGYQGRFGAAVGAQQDAVKGLAEAKEQGFYSTEVLTAYGYALAQAGRGDEAAKALTDALNAARADKNQPQISAALSYQGDNAYFRGDLKAAAAAYQESLQTALKSGDAHLVLLNKINLAKLAVANVKSAAAANELQTLGAETDSLGLKYLSTQCLVLRGEALIGTKDYAGALKELKSGALRSDKLKLRALLAQSQYQWGRALELSGNAADAQSHYEEARRAAAAVQIESQNPDLAKRYDLAPIFAGIAKYPFSPSVPIPALAFGQRNSILSPFCSRLTNSNGKACGGETDHTAKRQHTLSEHKSQPRARIPGKSRRLDPRKPLQNPWFTAPSGGGPVSLPGARSQAASACQVRVFGPTPRHLQLIARFPVVRCRGWGQIPCCNWHLDLPPGCKYLERTILAPHHSRS